MDKPTARDKEIATCLELVLEMNLRGFSSCRWISTGARSAGSG